jgi:hypothetical protein
MPLDLQFKQTDIPGFRRAASYGEGAILEQVWPPPHYRQLAKDGREPREPRVEDRLQPSVSAQSHF